MQIDYNVSEKDYINFNVFHMYQQKSLIKFKIITMIVALLGMNSLFFWAAGLKGPIDIVESVITALVISVVFILILMGLEKRLFRYSIKRMLESGRFNDFIGKQTIILHDDCIEDYNSIGSSRIKYSAVEKICCDFECYYIYIGAIKAFLIPSSSFSNDKQKQEFFNIFEQKTGIAISYYNKRHKKIY